jgi:hypothetical protein
MQKNLDPDCKTKCRSGSVKANISVNPKHWQQGAYQSLEVRDAVSSISTTAVAVSEQQQPDEQLYKCGLCTRQFSCRDVLRLHIDSGHATVRRPLNLLPPPFEIGIMTPASASLASDAASEVVCCSFCGEAFPGKSFLDHHTLTDHADMLELLDAESGRKSPPYFLLINL